MKRKIQPVITEQVMTLRAKLERQESLTSEEKQLEVSRDEAVYLLSALAGRTIKPDYMKQLIRTDKGEPRLAPARAVGNTYLYTVESLLGVRFTKGHETDEQKVTEDV